MLFDLYYLVDNGLPGGWQSDVCRGCKLLKWIDDGDYSIVGPDGKPIGYGETPEDAMSQARMILTERRRKADGIIPARIGSDGKWVISQVVLTV